MAGAVGAAVGVVSTVAGMGESSRQRNIQRQQAAATQYAQEVQYAQEKNAIANQRAYNQQQYDLESMANKALDSQTRMQLSDAQWGSLNEEMQLKYQIDLKQQTNKGERDAALQQVNTAEYMLNEQQAQRSNAAAQRQIETTGQASQQEQQIAKFLSEGNAQQAAALMMQAQGGQMDSQSSDIANSRVKEVANTLNALNSSGNLTEEALTQAVYEEDIANALKEAGNYDLILQRLGINTQSGVNDRMIGLQQDLLTSGAQKNRLGERIASNTFEGSVNVRDTQRGIDKKFSDMGYQSQLSNAGIRSGAAGIATQAQQQAASGSLFTTLANAASLGGSLYNAYNMMQPAKQYQSPLQQVPTRQRTQGVITDVPGNIYG